MANDIRWLTDLFALTIALSLFFGLGIGERALWAPVEGRYAEIASEMASSGDYVTPRLNGVEYLKKPPLFFWLEAMAIKLLGKSERAFRVWEVIFAVLGCLAVYAAGRRLFGRGAGLIAAVILATSPLYYAMSRTVSLDMPVTFFITCSLAAFLWSTQEPEDARRAAAMMAFYIFAALATLTKGLMGAVLPAMIVGSWMLLTRNATLPGTMLFPLGATVFLAITAPWHILVSNANPEFWKIYFLQGHIRGYLTGDQGAYNQSWAFLPVLLMGAFPWTVFLGQAIHHGLRPSSNQRRHEALFLALWAGVFFAFFSASGSKVIPYILPVFPPLAILLGRYLATAMERPEAQGIHGGYWLLLFGVLLLIVLGLATPQYYVERYSNWPSLGPPELDTTIVEARDASPADIPGLTIYTFVQGTILALGALLTHILGRHWGFRWAFCSLAGATALFLFVVNSSLPCLDARRSVKELALAMKPLLRPEDEVVSYHAYYQDLPVYVGRRTTVVSWRGNQFPEGSEDASGWIIDDATFWKRWETEQAIYMVTPKETYHRLLAAPERKLYLIAQTKYNVLLSNTPPSS